MKNLYQFRKRKLIAKRLTFIFLSILFLNNCMGQTHRAITKTVNTYIKGYWEYLPEDYNTSDKKYPLLIFLHGIGEMGDGSQSSLQLVLRHGPPRLIIDNVFPKTFTVDGKTFSFIVISPQLTANIRNEGVIRTLIDYCVQNYKVDTSRIYLTGLSMGGGISWIYAGQTFTNAKRLAALVPVCGNTDGWPGLVANVAKANLPVWIAHNKFDGTVPSSYSVNWFNGLNNYRPEMSPKPLFSLYESGGHDAWTQTYDLNYKPNGLNVFEWMLQYSNDTDITPPPPPPPANKAPVAVIEGTTSLSLPTTSTVLDGSSSSDNDGAIRTYNWKFVSGPGSYEISGATSPKATINKLTAGNYSFKLTVTDDKGATGTADAKVVVEKAGATNKAPVVVIKGSINLVLPYTSTILYGTSSTDDGIIKSYSWKYVSGPTKYTLSGNNNSIVKVSGLTVGAYTFQLTVTDDKGAASSKNVTVSVSEKKPVIIPNKPPTAIVDGSFVLTLPANSTVLSGSSSKDADGVIKSYSWKYISGPSSYSISGSNVSTATLKNLEAGNYFFQLTVTDDKGATGVRTVKIVVNTDAANIAPVAVIKGSTKLVLPATSTILYGTTSTDKDGTIKSYSWNYVSGPTKYLLTGASSSISRVSSMTPGIYQFRLTVSDNKGATASAYVNIDVSEKTQDTTGTSDTDSSVVGNGDDDDVEGGGINTDGDCGCTKYLEADGLGAIYTTGTAMKAVPGDVICVKAGKYKSIRLSDFHGTASKPIIFKNCGGKVTVSGYSAYGISVTKSTNFKFTGAGSSKEQYGFTVTSAAPNPYVATGFSAGYLTSDFEVDHIEVTRASAGVWIKTQVSADPLTWDDAFTMRNVSLHDIYVHDTHGEGYYIGHTAKYVPLTINGKIVNIVPQAIENLKLYNCIAEKTGWDGIQVAAVTANCMVYNNRVTNYGTTNAVSQQYGILIGGRCTGAAFNNYIENGTGAGMEVFAQNKISIYNNSIFNVGHDNSIWGQDGIFIDDRSLIGTTPLTVFVANNTIVKPKRDGIRFLNSYKNQSTRNVFYNNLVVNPGTYGVYGADTLRPAVDVVDKTMKFTASNNLCLSNVDAAKFKDAANLNFQLASSSPALNNGKDLTSLNVNSDIQNVLRPQGGVFDIGAYESTPDTTQTDGGNLVAAGTFQNIIDAGSTAKGLTLTPVPVKDRLHIYLNDASKGKIDIKIIDANGKIVAVKTNGTKDAVNWQNYIDVNHLPAGVYYFQASVAGKKFNSKFLVVK